MRTVRADAPQQSLSLTERSGLALLIALGTVLTVAWVFLLGALVFWLISAIF